MKAGAPTSRRTNIDPDTKREKERQRQMVRAQRSRHDQVRLTVGCPICRAQPGEFCRGATGLRTSHHSARHKAAAKPTPKPVQVAPSVTNEVAEKFGVTVLPAAEAKNYGGITPPVTRKHAATGTAAMAQQRFRGERQRKP